MAPFATLSSLLLLPVAIYAITLDCEHIRADNQKFNFKKLGGPKEVNWQRHTAPSITNTTFTLDICAPLKKDKNIKSDEQCPNGTRVCGIQRVYREGVETSVQEVIPIAGSYLGDGGNLDPKFTRLKGSSSHADSELEGVRGELHGGKWSGKTQKAIIEFVCDKKWEGTEGFGENKAMDIESYGSMGKREEPKDGDDSGGDEKDELPDLDLDKALQFKSYQAEKDDDVQVLRLTWKTKYACEDAADPEPDGKKSSGLGFFGWFFTVVFLAIAAYIIFGSWLNYNRYGARGWDLIPHGDTIRDIPYIVKDWTGGMMDRVNGGGARGGYSAV